MMGCMFTTYAGCRAGWDPALRHCRSWTHVNVMSSMHGPSPVSLPRGMRFLMAIISGRPEGMMMPPAYHDNKISTFLYNTCAFSWFIIQYNTTFSRHRS